MYRYYTVPCLFEMVEMLALSETYYDKDCDHVAFVIPWYEPYYTDFIFLQILLHTCMKFYLLFALIAYSFMHPIIIFFFDYLLSISCQWLQWLNQSTDIISLVTWDIALKI